MELGHTKVGKNYEGQNKKSISKHMEGLDMVISLGRRRQEDGKFEASLGYTE
jgi:hypothetical protein